VHVQVNKTNEVPVFARPEIPEEGVDASRSPLHRLIQMNVEKGFELSALRPKFPRQIRAQQGYRVWQMHLQRSAVTSYRDILRRYVTAGIETMQHRLCVRMQHFMIS
jgi:hypothetical protein